jgi:hypothetical protein
MVSVLVDTSLLHHAVAIKQQQFDTGTVLWGGSLPVQTYFTASVKSGHQIRESNGGDQTLFIASLARAFMASQHHAHQTDALCFERLHVPVSRYAGEGYGDASLFAHVKFSETFMTLENFSFTLPGDDPISKLREHIDNAKNRDFMELRNALEAVGGKERASQDSWHLYSALSLGLKFVSCDTKLKNQIRSISDKKIRQSLSDVHLLPSELCAELGLPKATDEEFEELAHQVCLLPFHKT